MIFYDPTESRTNSRLPDAVIDQGEDLPGLEAVTAADLLLTTDHPGEIDTLALVDDEQLRFLTTHFAGQSDPILPRVASAVNLPIPTVIAAHRLYLSCQNGLLVQRKTGSDLLSIVPNYSRILLRMLTWTDRPWLLFVGQLKSKDKFAVIDGRKSRFHYASVIGCIEAWQMGFQGYGGGFYTLLSSDDDVMPWINRWLNKLQSDEKVTLVPSRPATRPVIGEKRSWVQVLAAFHGIGPKKAKVLADYWGTLAGCIEYLSDSTSWKTTKIPDIGPGTIEQVRIDLGFEGDKSLRMVVEVNGDQR